MKPVPATSGLLFGSFLFRQDLHSVASLKDHWSKHFGESFFFIPKENPLAQYYSHEMGEDLNRVFFLTSHAYPREALLSAKLQSLDWENAWSKGNKRMVNVDIGFLSLENFLLATTKNYSHRTYIGENIFADLTYYFHQGELQTLPWTYPDYVDPEKKDFFHWGRSYLLQSLQAN